MGDALASLISEYCFKTKIMKTILSIILAALFIVSNSCTKDDPNADLALEWEIGKNEYNIEIDDTTRNFLIHVPESYSGDAPVPIVMMLHGSTGTGTKFYNISRWVEKSEEEGFIAVFPTALAYPLKENNRTSTKWASEGLIEQVVEGTEIKDDAPFISELVERCEASFNIDDKQVFISGFSNGGGFVKTVIIPRLGDLFAAASTGGGLGLGYTYDIQGDRIMPLFNIIETKDHNMLEAIQKQELPIQADKLEKLDLVWDKIQTMVSMLDLGPEYVEEPHNPTHNILRFQNDNSGQGNEYVVMLVDELDHKYPNEVNNPHQLVAADILWEWYQKWSL